MAHRPGKSDLWLKKLEVEDEARRRETDLVEIWKHILRKEARKEEKKKRWKLRRGKKEEETKND